MIWELLSEKIAFQLHQKTFSDVFRNHFRLECVAEEQGTMLLWGHLVKKCFCGLLVRRSWQSQHLLLVDQVTGKTRAPRT